jgi:hypothetical protein
MSVNLIWDDAAQTILCYEFVDPWRVDDYQQAHEAACKMLAAQPCTTDIILDFSQGQHIPSGIIGHLNRSYFKMAPNTGAVMVVGPNTFMHVLGDIMQKLHPSARVRTFKTRAEARAALSLLRASSSRD